jgi:hypothetical protein
VSIAQQAAGLFIAWYSYDVDGRAQWFVAPAGAWFGAAPGAQSWTADVFRVTGAPVIGAPYDPARASAAKVGTLTLKFDDDNRALMTYDVASQRGTYNLRRLGF